MPSPNFAILYVSNPAASADFYARLLERPPLESSPTFVMFALDAGWMLGLWAAHTVAPAATPAGGSELAITVGTPELVEEMHRRWAGQGLTIVQPPTAMDFGHTFVAADLDGHRLRVFAPTSA